MPLRRDAPAVPWKGVNLGGWLLLEPGPSRPLFDRHPIGRGGELARCEWDLLTALRKAKGKKYVSEMIKTHRETHISKADFQEIRSAGLNAVRLPIGYWVLLGPAKGEPYEGPAIEYVDRAVDWAEECGLQIVLDLHGCPGGESGEAPCGRRQRPDGTWKWRDWRFGESLKAVELLAKRYHTRRCVTGVAVCNEPSNEVPQSALCRYYEKAILRIRAAGMPAERVSVICPLFQRDEDQFISYWRKLTGNKHRNVCFDVHCYHCFENFFNGLSLAQQLRYTEENAAMLHEYPMVVGEWSLALGVASWCTCGNMEESDVYKRFAATQLEAFRKASHGTFFWNWTEREDSLEWNYKLAHAQGIFSTRFTPFPKWSSGEDPLEDELHPSPCGGPYVHWGDEICLRTFYGRYVDVEGTKVNARWGDKGTWQQLSFHPASVPAPSRERHKIRSGEVVRVQSNNGRFLAWGDGQVAACRRLAAPAGEFILHVEGSIYLKHRSKVYLECRGTKKFVNADAEVDGLFVAFEDRGEHQGLVVEKYLSDEPEVKVPKVSPVKKTPTKRHSKIEDPSPNEDKSAPVSKKRPAVPAASPPAKSRKLCDSTSALRTPVKASRA